MKKKIINSVVLSLLLSTMFLTGCDDRKSPKPIIKLIQQKSALAIGTNFETGKPVVLNPLTGKEIQPCDKIGNSDKYQPVQEKYLQSITSKTMNQKCNTEIVVGDNQLLQKAVESSQRIIQGKINKNRKSIDARYVVSVTALYKGSYCSTSFSAGAQYENCVSKQEECIALGIPTPC